MVRDCEHPRATHTHGTLLAYINDRCRCRPCKDANSANCRTRRRLKAYGVQLDAKATPITGTLRRVEALGCLGWSYQALSAKLGWHESRLNHIVQQTAVAPRNARAVAALYDQLWDQPAPTDTRMRRTSATRTRNAAARLGWLPPMAWDDAAIDDPDTQPNTGAHSSSGLDEVAVERACHGDRIPLTRAELIEAIRRLHDRGRSLTETGDTLGLTAHAVFKIRHRDLAAA